MMTTSPFQLRQLQHITPNHRSSLTLYTHGKPANPLLPCLAERKIGGKVAIVPSKMTNGVHSGISEPIDIRATQKVNNQKRGGKIYVTCLQTSLSTTWKRSLSQESDQKDNINDEEDMSSHNQNTAKRNDRNRVQSRASKGHNISASDNIDLNPQGGKEKAGRTKKGNRLERQDSNVSIQLSKGKQLNIISEGKSSVSSYSETNLSTASCNSYVYIKNKFNAHKTGTVLIQKSPLCRSITISEASLSSALSRQANISPSNRSSSSRTRNSPRYISGISVQNPNKRSFTISNDTTDGRLRTIYESTMEEHHE